MLSCDPRMFHPECVPDVIACPEPSTKGPQELFAPPTRTLYSSPGAGRVLSYMFHVACEYEYREGGAGRGEGRETYAVEGSAAVGEELEPVRRACGLVGEAALGGATVPAGEVRARGVLRGLGDALHVDLEDAAPPRAEAELELPVVHHDVPVDCVHSMVRHTHRARAKKEDDEEEERGGRTGVVRVALLRADDRAMVLPRAGLHRGARRDPQRGVLRAELRDRVVERVLPVDELHVRRPEAAVLDRDVLDHGAVREHGPDGLPRALEGRGRERPDALAGGEDEVLLARGVVRDRGVAQLDVACGDERG